MIDQPFKRILGFWDSVAINVGVIVGVGIFRVPSEVAQYLDTSTEILLAWTCGGLIALIGGLCYGELASRLPLAGGNYVYLKEAYGKPVAFLYGWMEISVIRAASIAAVAYILSDYLRSAAPFQYVNDKVLTISSIGLFTILNTIGLRLGTEVQKCLSAFKVIAILTIAGLIFAHPEVPEPKSTALFTSISFNGRTFFLALIPILWTYGGWHESTFMSGEFKDTQKALPRSLIASILIVTALYLLINLAYLKYLPPLELARSEAAASDALKRIFGESANILMSAVIALSAAGALNAMILTGGRIPFAVASDYARSRGFSTVHARFGTPLYSILINGIWASLLVLWGTFEELLFFSGFAVWLFFALAGLSIFVLRNRFPSEKPFSAWGYPFTPLLFTLVSAWLCLATVLYAPKAALAGAGLFFAGLPIYFWIRQKN